MVVCQHPCANPTTCEIGKGAGVPNTSLLQAQLSFVMALLLASRGWRRVFAGRVSLGSANLENMQNSGFESAQMYAE